ncbi:MAG: helix-turn-helix domain-containing protein [Actinomycetota bacterium]
MSDDFAQRLKSLRKDRGLTQKQLAETAVGVSAGYIALLETAQRRPSVETVTSLAIALKCSALERADLFDARDAAESESERVQHYPPIDVNSAALRMATVAERFRQLSDEVDAITEQLGSQWAGSSASAYGRRLEEWRNSSTGAAQALTKMSDSLLMYAQRLSELDDAVAESLSDD